MSQISAFNPIDQALQPSTPSRFQELSSEDFVRIIFTELSNQDPFQPSDTGALLEQLNSIRSIESDIRLTDRLESLVFENQLATAGATLGRLVTGLSDRNDRATGIVTAVVREGEEVQLELDDGSRIPIDNVEAIVEAPPETPPAPSVPIPPPAPAGEPTG
jgi:flagellar basal-body rod modification protein FlgD